MNRHFPRKVKRLAWQRCAGLCEMTLQDGERCGAPLTAGNRIYDHGDMWEVSRDSGTRRYRALMTERYGRGA